MDEEVSNLISALGNEEAIERLKSLLREPKEDCKGEIERLKQQLAEKERELQKMKKFTASSFDRYPNQRSFSF